MEINDLIKIASTGYIDGYLEKYWDFENECPITNSTNELGDMLLVFIVRSLKDTFDPDMTDVEQLTEARHTLDDAIDELMDVGWKLDEERVKRK